MTRIAAALTVLLLLPLAAAGRMPVVADSLTTRFEGRTPAPVEGVWLIADGSQLLIERDGDGGFAVTRLHGDDLRLPPNSSVGRLVPEDMRGTRYRATLATTVSKGRAAGSRTFDVTVADESSPDRGTLTLRPRGKFNVDLWLLYRMLVTFKVKSKDEPTELHAIRLYPNPTPSADFPFVL